MGNQAPAAAKAIDQINPGDVVVFKPSHLCPSIWRDLAEHLEGKTFQVAGTARLIYWDALVLQPWPCTDEFPSFQLTEAESLQLAGEAAQ